jgi:1-acyl-sn-glycerol-3-phosphate acyltransferase
VYNALALIIRVLFIKKLGVNFHYKIKLKDYKAPYIIVSNHASRLDYIYVSTAFAPYPLNYVAGFNEFFRSHLTFVFRLAQAIPKMNFVSDPYCIKEMHRVVRARGRLVFFPEGMSSISGANQPCAISSGKLLKYFKLPVLQVKIAGGYLTTTKYCMDERPGRVDVTVDSLFTPEDLEAMSANEIQLKLDEALTHDDYAWNKQARVAYDGKGRMAHNLHTLLYWCPKCGSEFTMRGEGNRIVCSHCGNGAELNEYYDLIPLDDTCVIPETPRVWFDMERKNVREWVAQSDFELRENVKLGVLPRDHYLQNQATSEIAGSGRILLNREGFHFAGERYGKPFAFSILPELLATYGMCTDVTRFYTFYNNEFLEFFPERESTIKLLLATEENHRRAGGAWKDFPALDQTQLP